MTQLAVVNFSATPLSVELREVPEAVIGEDDVLLEVASVGVCGSDLHMWTGHQSWKVEYPMVLGHEFAGVIRAVGSRVRASGGWKEGDRVVSETHAVINPDSPLTRQGLYNLDPGRKGFGAAISGAMTRRVCVPARILHRVPEHVSFDEASLTEPCCVAYNAVVMNSSIRPGDRVLVLGPGPIGVLCAVIAKLNGAQVALGGLERDLPRLKIAETYGVKTIVGDATNWSKNAPGCDGFGCEGVIDATGVSIALKTALDLVRPNGWITKVGWGPQPLNFSLDPLVQKNVRLQGSFSHNWPIWERIIALMASGQLDVKPIIGGTWPLEKWHDAFETMHSGKIVKAVLRPGTKVGAE